MKRSQIRIISCVVALLFGKVVWADLAWENIPEARVARLNLPSVGSPGFRHLSNQVIGISFSNTLSFARNSTNQNFLNGSGVAAGDFDNDGWCDIYFCSLEGRNALYKNLGNWRFQEVARTFGVECADRDSDLNGDSWLDLLVSSVTGPGACFMNFGQFTNTTLYSGLISSNGSTSMALADVDSDGDLDLFRASYGRETIRSANARIRTRTVNGREVVIGPFAHRLKLIDGMLVESGEAAELFLNDGSGRFSSSTRAAENLELHLTRH